MSTECLLLFTNDEAICQLIKGAGEIYSFDQVKAALETTGWIVHPVTYCGKIIGAIIQKGAEIHTSIAPEFQKRWNPRSYIKSILYPALQKYGEIFSEADKSDLRSIRWLTKLGFTIINEDEKKIYLKLTEIKF